MSKDSNKQDRPFDKMVLAVLTGSENVFLFDNAAVNREVPHYIDNILELCEVTVRKPFEFWGGHVSEDSLLSSIGSPEHAKNIGADENASELSNYRLLCDALEHHETGVVVVHNAEKLRNESIHILSRLAAFCKRMKLRWQFLLFADLAEFDDLLLMQLQVDKYYPASMRIPTMAADDRLSNESNLINAQAKKSIWIIVLAVGLAAVAVLIWTQIQRPSEDELTKPLTSKSSQRTLDSEAVDSDQELADRRRQSRLQAMHELRIRDLEFDRVLNEIEAQQSDSNIAGDENGASASDLKSESRWSAATITDTDSRRVDPRPVVKSVIFSKMSDRMVIALDSSDAVAVKQYYDGGEDKNAVNDAGETALAVAVKANDQNLVNQLIAYPVSANFADQNGHSPLFYAAIGGSRQIAQTLLATGANVNSLSVLNKTPLMAATHNAHIGLVKLFINSGAKLNLQDHSGWSALQYAAWNNNLPMVELLLERGANPRLRDKDGYTAEDISKLRGHQEVADLIAQAR